jgi:hypothetical protein
LNNPSPARLHASGRPTTLFLLAPSGDDKTIRHEDQWSSYRFLHLALDTCCSSTKVVETSLRAGNELMARKAFRKAEEAFEEAQQYFVEVDREERRIELHAFVDELGLKLDELWIRFKSNDSWPQRRANLPSPMLTYKE